VVSTNGTNSPRSIQETAIIKNNYATVIVRRGKQVQSSFCVEGQGIICNSRLLLFRCLITPCETALLETPFDTDGHVIWDPSGKVGNLLETDISESGLSDVRGEPEESLSDLAGARVLVIESGDKENWTTANIDLIMDRSLREKGALTFGQDVVDEGSTVLLDETGFHLSVYEVKELGRSGVGVRGIHAAWSKHFNESGRIAESRIRNVSLHLYNSHGHTVGEQGGEICNVSGSDIATCAPCGPKVRGEVE